VAADPVFRRATGKVLKNSLRWQFEHYPSPSSDGSDGLRCEDGSGSYGLST
jgi:hypothetical protein